MRGHHCCCWLLRLTWRALFVCSKAYVLPHSHHHLYLLLWLWRNQWKLEWIGSNESYLEARGRDWLNEESRSRVWRPHLRLSHLLSLCLRGGRRWHKGAEVWGQVLPCAQGLKGGSRGRAGCPVLGLAMDPLEGKSQLRDTHGVPRTAGMPGGREVSMSAGGDGTSGSQEGVGDGGGGGFVAALCHC